MKIRINYAVFESHLTKVTKDRERSRYIPNQHSLTSGSSPTLSQYHKGILNVVRLVRNLYSHALSEAEEARSISVKLLETTVDRCASAKLQEVIKAQ